MHARLSYHAAHTELSSSWQQAVIVSYPGHDPAHGTLRTNSARTDTTTHIVHTGQKLIVILGQAAGLLSPSSLAQTRGRAGDYALSS
jgi:hypothetical protein